MFDRTDVIGRTIVNPSTGECTTVLAEDGEKFVIVNKEGYREVVRVIYAIRSEKELENLPEGDWVLCLEEALTLYMEVLGRDCAKQVALLRKHEATIASHLADIGSAIAWKISAPPQLSSGFLPFNTIVLDTGRASDHVNGHMCSRYVVSAKMVNGEYPHVITSVVPSWALVPFDPDGDIYDYLPAQEFLNPSKFAWCEK